MGKEVKETKSKSKKIFVFLIALLVLGGAVFGGVYFGLNKNNSANATVVIEEAYYELGEIFVNLSDEGGKRYVKLTLSVTYDVKNKDLAGEIETKKVALRDTAIFYFKSLQVKDFTSENELILKKDLVNKLNTNLTNGLLIDVKFNELLLQ